MAQMVNQIMAGQPLAVGIDMIFAERDRYSPEVLAERLPALSKSALAGLNEPDSFFSKALSQGPTVLAVVGVARQLPGARQPHKPLPALAEANLAEQPILRFPAALASRPQLEAAAAGEGLINASPDKLSSSPNRGVLRHTPTIAFIDQQPFLSHLSKWCALPWVRKAASSPKFPGMAWSASGLAITACRRKPMANY